MDSDTPETDALLSTWVRCEVVSDHARALERRLAAAERNPIDAVLYCPKCDMQHIDAPEAFKPSGECTCAGPDQCENCASNQDAYREWLADGPWTNPPHKSHLCHDCKHIWRPSDHPTNGVKALSSGKDADTQPARATLAERELAEARIKHKADLAAAFRDHDADVKDLEGKLAEARELLKLVDCTCSLRERESGHLVGCWKPDFDAAIDSAREGR